ncbi:MAG: aminotransferase class I/II-fold pyridoxal phosphate-dependent enzyme [Richelia sp. RM1_1_1]|nr:aminotransferase class I/II-fold pyridoxal phosphate-dependent enzyme [Richelia sp. RM1_1_1]
MLVPFVTESIAKELISSRAAKLTESITVAISLNAHKYKAIDLALGNPDFPVIEEIKEAGVQAIRGDINHYANPCGTKILRNAIAEKTSQSLNIKVDPETEITVTCGTTEAMINTLMTIVDPGDEVIVFEPFFGNYVQALTLCGAVPRYVRLHSPSWYIDERELTCAFNDRTKAVILNTPSNPTGKVFSSTEISLISDLCNKWDVVCVSDEIYEHIVFDGLKHISLIQSDDMRHRLILISGMSKTYGVTGWRIGYAIAPPKITNAIRAVHSCTTVGTASPLQTAGVVPLQMPEEYYQKLRRDYQFRRDRLSNILEPLGFVCYKPQGAFYMMANISKFGFANDVDFANFLLKEVGIAVVPGSSFYSKSANINNMVRLCFAKSESTLNTAEERLAKLAFI